MKFKIISSAAVCGLIAMTSPDVDTMAADNTAPLPAQLSPQETREAFLKLIDRPRVDLNAGEEDLPLHNGFAQHHFHYMSEATQQVPGIILGKPELFADRKRHPVAILLHGTTGKKEGLYPVMEKIAAKGIFAVAIDGRFHGERGTFEQYNDAIAQAFIDGKSHPLYLDTCWDAMRLIDYLQTRKDIDPDRIGMMGFSKGGVETWLTSAVDERVRVVVPAISMQSLDYQLKHNIWQDRANSINSAFYASAKAAGVSNPGAEFVRQMYTKLVPGLFDRFDGPQMFALIAPRPVLVISGERDPIMPIASVQPCIDRVRPVYAAAGAADKLKFLIEPGVGHVVTPEAGTAAAEWFNQWLNRADAK